MQIIREITDFQIERNKIFPEKSVGFVPTMGFLHKGHASLLRRSATENNITLLSIFVNPTQFNDPSDYENYPKNLERDLALASEWDVDYVWIPHKKDIYPNDYLFSFDIRHPLANLFEGRYRPGHFNGVLTVVMKLLQITKPKRAYFGEKDYQQYRFIRSLVSDFFISTEIIGCPTIREDSGLPYSSRNARLSLEEKRFAEDAFLLIQKANAHNLSEIRAKLMNVGVPIDYLDIYEGRIFFAIRIGNIRLIDNFIIEPSER